MADARWTSTAPPRPRIRGRELQRLRARLFARCPGPSPTEAWCVLCLKVGTQTLATIRDHKIPLAEGGRDDATNDQPLCVACNRAKAQDEAARGRRRYDRGDIQSLPPGGGRETG
jgi:5-methylcytosine-specific restriction protein A